jgi:hypothetical protein
MLLLGNRPRGTTSRRQVPAQTSADAVVRLPVAGHVSGDENRTLSAGPNRSQYRLFAQRVLPVSRCLSRLDGGHQVLQPLFVIGWDPSKL